MTSPTWGVSSAAYERARAECAASLGIAEISSPALAYIASGARVLELGCSTGRDSEALTGRGCSVVGVELDPQAAAQAAVWCERVVVCDLDTSNLPLLIGHDAFDAILAADVLEHLRDPARLLRSLTSLLAPNGTVVASVPNIAHGSIRLSLLQGRFAYEEVGILDRTHLRFFTAESLPRLFEEAGYELTTLDRLELPIDYGQRYDPIALPPGCEDAVRSLPDALTYEFVAVARRDPAQSDLTPAVGGESSPGFMVQLDEPAASALRDKEEMIKNLQAEVAQLALVQHRLSQTQQQLAAIAQSPVWRMWQGLRRSLKQPLNLMERFSARRRRSDQH